MRLGVLEDDSRKVFNIVKLHSPADVRQWDERWFRCWANGRDFMFFDQPIGMAPEFIRNRWAKKGFALDETFFYTRRHQRESLPKRLLGGTEVALLVLNSTDTVRREVYRDLLEQEGYTCHEYCYDLDNDGWIAPIQENHYGRIDPDTGMEFISVPDTSQPRLVVLEADIGEDAGFAVFRTLRGRMEPDVPVIVVSQLTDSDPSAVVRAMRLGAENIVARSPDFRSALERAIDDSVPVSVVARRWRFGTIQ